MKYLLTGACFLILGFAAGYFVFLRDQNSPADALEPSRAPLVSAQSNVSSLQKPVPLVPILSERGTSSQPLILDYDVILMQSTVFEQLYLAYQFSTRVSVPELERWALRAAGSDDPLQHFSLASLFLERLLHLDPVATLDFLNSHERLKTQEFFGHLFTSWARNDLAGAVEHLDKVESPGIRLWVTMRLLEDPTISASPLLDSLRESFNPVQLAQLERRNLSRQPPELSFDLLLDRSKTDARQSGALMNSFMRWMSLDPEAALARVLLLESDPLRTSLMRSGLSHLAGLDFPRALSIARDYDPSGKIARQVILVGASKSASQVLVEAEAEFSQSQDTEFMLNFMGAWAQHSPREALRYAEGLDRLQVQAYARISHNYMARFPEEAYDWAMALSNEHFRIKEMAVSVLARNDFDRAESELTSLTDSRLRRSLLTSMASQLGRSDPEAALDWLNRNYVGEEGYRSAFNSVLRHWGNADPAGAGARLLQETESNNNTLSALIPRLVSSWYRQDIKGVADWVQDLPAGGLHDAGYAALSRSALQYDVDQALDYAFQISEISNRSNTLFSVALQLLERGERDVEAVIERTELNDAMANNLRRRAEVLAGKESP